MKRLGVGVIAALLCALVAVPVVEAAPSSPFTGSWVGTDPVDGSTQHLYVMGGATVQVLYVDEFGTVCSVVGAPTNVFTGVLTGRVSGNEMDTWFKRGGCGPVIELAASDFFGWTFLYDAGSDTIYGALEDGPTTWRRG